MAARDQNTRPDFINNVCHDNMLSGLLLFSQAQALILDNTFENNKHWGAVLTPDCEPTPKAEELLQSNTFRDNPRGEYTITSKPLTDIGR